MHDPSLIARYAFRLPRAGIADRRLCSVLHLLRLQFPSVRMQQGSLWTDIDIVLTVVGEVRGTIVCRLVLPIGQRYVSPDPFFAL
jgi:hypothetical protein